MENENTENTENAEENKGDDLDTLLADISSSEEKTEPVKAEPKAEVAEVVKPDADKRFERMDAFIERQEERELQTELSGVAGRMRDASPALKNMPETALVGYIEREARNSPAIQTAWTERGSDPARFNQIVDGLAKKFGDGLAPVVDTQLTEDRRAVEAFVSSQGDVENSEDAKPQSELSAMSLTEIQSYAKQVARSN